MDQPLGSQVLLNFLKLDKSQLKDKKCQSMLGSELKVKQFGEFYKNNISEFTTVGVVLLYEYMQGDIVEGKIKARTLDQIESYQQALADYGGFFIDCLNEIEKTKKENEALRKEIAQKQLDKKNQIYQDKLEELPEL